MREADLPAEQPEAQEEARVQGPYEYARRPSSAEDPARPRPLAALGLIHRIRSRATFSSLARVRPIRRGPIWVRRVALGAGPPQVGYAIGRATGNAVTRNRLRRQLRTVMSTHAGELQPGTAYLVGAGSDAKDLAYTALEGHVVACLAAAS